MEFHFVIVIIGALLLLSLVANEIGTRTRMPRVTLLMLFGIAVGPSGFDLLPVELDRWYAVLASIALTMVAFLLGGKLSIVSMRKYGKAILSVSLAAVSITVMIVGGGLIAMGTALPVALLLAGVATSTAPAATQDVVRQTRAGGRFTETLLGVVAVDDAWGLIVFSLLLILAKTLAGDGAALVLAQVGWEVGGAVLIGALLGFPAAYLTGRLQPGEPMQSEALGLVFLCAGLSVWLDVSFLLAGMVTGAIVTNFASHHNRPFHEIEHVEWPFMVLFFVLAGATLNIAGLDTIGMIGAAYIVLRLVSRILGGWIGGSLGGLTPLQRNWMGYALVPQAGVALGMALVGGSYFPEFRETLMAVTIGTTVVFELAGPLLTQMALTKVGETGRAPEPQPD